MSSKVHSVDVLKLILFAWSCFLNVDNFFFISIISNLKKCFPKQDASSSPYTLKGSKSRSKIENAVSSLHELAGNLASIFVNKAFYSRFLEIFQRDI